jgi:ketosteroid isomerase-like protein
MILVFDAGAPAPPPMCPASRRASTTLRARCGWMSRVSLDATAATIADSGLSAFVSALARREPAGIMQLFTDNASLFGSEDSEFAIGKPALAAFVGAICAQPVTYRWEWRVTAAGSDGDVVWFVAPGAAIVTGDDGTVTRVEPYRLSGVLRSTDAGWRFELFNGSEPTVPA